MSDPLLVMTTMPDAAAGEKLAERLVEAGLAACVNIGAPMTSVYKWKGRIERGTEVQLTIKTNTTRYADLEREISAAHPYELPEIIAVPITAGLADYLTWIDTCTRS